MIFGIGHDIVENQRIGLLVANYGQRFINKVLSNLEQDELLKRNVNPKRQILYIAKRFAAKEAFAKACGIGIRPPILMPNISIINDALGKPSFIFATNIQQWLRNQGIANSMVSMTDEKTISSAFVVLELKV
jgi:holo-[acyl-carrier protein] synthase